MRTSDAIHNAEAGSERTRASGARRLKVGLAAVVVFMATFAGLTAAGVSPASASTLNGTATIANPNGLAPLSSGGSTTQYTITLPSGASCDGDTASNGYHVFSYLVPEGTNPTAVSFATGLPTDYPDAPTGLFTATGNYYGPANTAVSTGQIINIPGNLEFAPMLTRGLPLGTLLYNGDTSGVWEAGIACANSTGAVTDYWNTEITFTSSGSDPHGFTWSDTPGPCVANATVGFYSAASASFTQQTNDNFAATSTGCPDPTITETGTLPSGVTLATSGLLSGSPTQPGSFPIVLSAAIGGGTPATQNFTLTVPIGVPYPPTGVSATAGSDSASVSFTAPTNNGGASITSYKVTATDTSDSAGSTTATGTTSPINATKLFGGDTYTFTVAAVNSVGTGTSSASSSPVTLAATAPATPAAPTATVGNQSATVNWAPPNPEGEPITGYVVTPYLGATAQTPVDVGDVSSTTVTGLTNGDAYTFTVAATNSVGTGSASPASNSVTPVTVPDAPATPTATAGDQTATVNWTAPGDEGSPITGYVVTPYDNGTAGTAVDVGPTVFSYTFNALNNGDSYTYTVAATNSVGTGTASAQSAAVVPATLPDAPAAPTATAGNTQASVNWTPPFDEGSTITGYVVTPYDNSTAGTPVDVGNVTTYTFDGLNNGDTYTFTVAAINGVGTGAASPASNAVVPATVPDAPAAPTASSTAPAEAVVNWTAPSDSGSAITGYVVTPYDNGTAGTAVDVGADVSTYTFDGLNNGDSYTFTVAAANAVGTGIASPYSNAVVPATVPDAPTIGTATGGDAEASVAFTPPAFNGGSSIISYTVTATDSTNPENGGQTASGSSSPVEVTDLTNGDSYTFTVTATNVVGTGAASSASNVVVPATVPGAPTIGTATAGNEDATVSFTPTPPASDGGSSVISYTVTATDLTNPENGGQTASGSSSPVEVTDLTNGDSYTFTVTATNGVGTGAASSASNAVVPYTVPGAPTSVTATAGKGSVKLTWKAPSSSGGSAITGYVITPSSGSAKTVGDVLTYTLTGLTNGKAYTFTVAAENAAGKGATSTKSKSVTPDGLYIVTTTLPKATKGKKYSETLTSKYGVGKLTWTATGLPAGLKLSTAGVLSGTDTGAAKTYTVTVTVTDSSTPTKQKATAKLSLVVLS
jgi:hypothetical protein